MSLLALASGAIFRGVEIRTSKNGRPFASTTLKCRDGDATTFVKVLAFSDHAIAALERLSDGDGVAVQGAFKCEPYDDKDGGRRVALTIFADNILPLRPPPRERKPKAAPPATAPDRSPLARHAGDGVDEFGDEIPF